MRNAIANRFPNSLKEEGKLFENYVLTEILKLGFQVKYWLTKTGLEVDFIAEKNGFMIPVETKINASPEKIERGLRSFIDKYKPKLAVVVFYEGTPGELIVNGCRVIFTDIYGFLGLTNELKK